jgi:GntR family transcriptional regulator/MocR family aminotransferase
MPLWDLPIPLDPSRPEPLYLQLVQGLVARIQGGSLKPGDPIPGTRALAEQLGIHRNTVLAAFRELVAEGWIDTKVGEGTFVSATPPITSPSRIPPRRKASPTPTAPPVRFQVQTGHPDGRLIPTEAFARAYRWALRMVNRDGGPADPLGALRLRLALVDMLAYSRGLRAEPECLMVTPGGGAALALAADSLLAPDDVVAVESPGSPTSWETLRKRGVELVAVPVDAQGLDTSALERLCAGRPVRAVFTTPQRQYPTTVPLGRERRQHLLELARRQGFLILEYDHDTEFQFEGVPPLPLASQEGVPVVFLGALSKIFAPGMRLGLIHGPEGLIRRIAEAREASDLPGDPVLEWAIIDLLESGELLRHLNRTRRVYQARRDHLATQLAAAFGDRLTFALPAGGMALWLTAADGTDMDAWSLAASREGVHFRASSAFELGKRPGPGARLAFGAHDEHELTEVVRRLQTCQPPA